MLLFHSAHRLGQPAHSRARECVQRARALLSRRAFKALAMNHTTAVGTARATCPSTVSTNNARARSLRRDR